MTITTALVAVVVFLVHRPVFTWQLIVGSVICGASWSFAQILQVKSFDMLPVSMAMPISTGEQLVGTALVGAAILGEWRFGWQWILGMIALVVLIGGICMTAYHEKHGNTDSASIRKGIIMLTVSAVGYTLSQLNVVVSTIGGLLLLHEMKTKKELKFTLGGLLLVVAGAIMIGITKF